MSRSFHNSICWPLQQQIFTHVEWYLNRQASAGENTKDSLRTTTILLVRHKQSWSWSCYRQNLLVTDELQVHFFELLIGNRQPYAIHWSTIQSKFYFKKNCQVLRNKVEFQILTWFGSIHPRMVGHNVSLPIWNPNRTPPNNEPMKFLRIDGPKLLRYDSFRNYLWKSERRLQKLPCNFA